MKNFFKSASSSRSLDGRRDSVRGRGYRLSFGSSISPRRNSIASILFRNDENGTACRILWEKYFEFFSLSDIDNRSLTIAEASYSTIIDYFQPLTDAFITCYDIRNREVLIAIQGHPTIMIEHIIQQFLSFISIKNTSDINAYASYTDGYSWLSDPSYGESILNETITASLNSNLFSSVPIQGNNQPFQLVNIRQRQQHFLNIVTLVAIVMRWPHNQTIILGRYGFGFARIIIDILHSLEENVEDLVARWCEVNESNDDKLLESTTFALHVILQIIHIYASDGVTIPKSEYTAIPLDQPLTLSMISELVKGNISDHSTPTSTRPSSSLSQSSDSNQADGALNLVKEADNLDWGAESTILGFLDPFIGLSSIGVLSSILRKLSHLSAALTQKIESIKSISPSAVSSPNISDRLHTLWRYGVIIQVEILSSFLKVMRCSSNDFCNQYILCAGCYSLKSLLSLKDINTYTMTSDCDRMLIGLRTILSLRLNLGVTDVVKSSSTITNVDDSSFIQPEFLYPVISHMIRCPYDDVMIPNDSHDLDIEYLAPCHIPVTTMNSVISDTSSTRNHVKAIDPVSCFPVYDAMELKSKSSHNFYSTRYHQHRHTDKTTSHIEGINIFQVNHHTEYLDHFFDIFYSMIQRIINDDEKGTNHKLSKILLSKFLLHVRQEYSNLSESCSSPLFQYYILKFIMKLRDNYSTYALQLIYESKILILFVLNANFLSSGQKKVNSLLKFGRRKVRFTTAKPKTDKSSEPQDYWYRVAIEAIPASSHHKATLMPPTSSSSSSKKFYALHFKFIHDMILDLLMSIMILCVDPPATTDNNIASSLVMQMFNNAIDISIKSLITASSHDITLQICRMLCATVNLVTVKSFRSKVWSTVMSEIAEVCKNHVASLNSLDVQGDNLIFHAETLPCFWPARVAVLNLIQAIASSSECPGWIKGFLIGVPLWSNPNTPRTGAISADDVILSTGVTSPLQRSKTSEMNVFGQGVNIDDKLSELSIVPMKRSVSDLQSLNSIGSSINNSNNNARSSITGSSQHVFHRHLAILRLILYPRCRYIALYIITQIFKECSSTVFGNISSMEEGASLIIDFSKEEAIVINNPRPTSPRSSSIQMFSSEALAHDIIRVCLHIIRSSSRQKELEDSFFSAYSVLETLIKVISTSSNLSYRTWYWKIFERFGPMTSSHKDLSWRRSYANVYIELWQSYEECVKYPKCSWSKEMKMYLLHLILKFMSVMLSGNDVGKSILGQILFTNRTKTSSSSDAVATVNDIFSASRHDTNHTISQVYEDIVDIIVYVETQPSSETITMLFEMLFDNAYDFHDIINLSHYGAAPTLRIKFDDVLPTFTNINIIPLLVSLIPHCSETMQQLVLDTLLAFIDPDTSLVNLFKCTKMEPSLFELLLDIFTSILPTSYIIIGELLETIGKYVITVAQLKRVFRLINIRFHDYSYTLLGSLQGMTNKPPGPQNFLFFEGEMSSLLLPHMQKWPATKGYAISLWFTVNLSQSSISVGIDKSVQSRTLSRTASTMLRKGFGRSMYILSFRQDSGIGIDVSLYLDYDASMRSGSKLSLRVKSCGLVKDPQQTIEIPIVNGISFDMNDRDSISPTSSECWHHLLLSHSPSTLRRKSEMTICLDGSISKHILSYPRYTDCINYPVIGDCNPIFKDENQHINFKGKLGSIFFFADAISDEQMIGIYKLGSSYGQLFNDYEHSSSQSNSHIDPLTLKTLNGSLTSLIMLAYNPGVWKQRYLLDITPEKNLIRWKVVADTSSMKSKSHTWTAPNALRMKATYRCMTKNMRDAFDCLGGVKVLLPMLAQLDSPSSSISSTYHESGLLCSKILELFFTLLRDTPVNIAFINDSAIFALSYVLEKISAEHLTVHVLAVLVHGYTKLNNFHEFQADMLRYIIGNFRLWIRTSYDVQMLLLDHLLTLSSSSSSALSDGRPLYEAIAIPKFFDALLYLYTYQVTFNPIVEYTNNNMDDLLSTPMKTRHGSSFDMAGNISSIYRTRSSYNLDSLKIIISKEQISSLRPKIFQIIYTILTISTDVDIYEQIITSLLSYIASESIPSHKIEGLQLLLRMLSPSKQQFITNLMQSSSGQTCIYVLTTLHSHTHAKVRVYASICFCSIIQLIVAKGSLPSSILYESPLEAMNASSSIPSESTKIESSSSKLTEQQSYPTKAVKADNIDTLSSFGIPLTQLSNHFVYLHTLLRRAVRDSSESILPDNQFEIIFQAFQLTMHGLSCKSLVSNIEKCIPIDATVMHEPSTKYYRANEQESGSSHNIASMKICIVSILPALVDIIRNDVISRSCRIKFLLELKTSLQTFDNLEMVLSLPRWQMSFFDLLADEQVVLNIAMNNLQSFGWNGDLSNPIYSQSNENHDDLNVMQDCKSMFEIVKHIMSEIHIHAIRFCTPLSEYIISSPSEVSVSSKYARMNARELLEFYSKGHRKLGASAIEETISYLRSYAEHSDFDVRLTGVDLLLNLIEGIKREKDAIMTTLSESPELREIRRKLFEVNIWMITYIVSEFFTIPPMQHQGTLTANRSSVKLKLEDAIEFVESYAVIRPPRTSLQSNMSSKIQVSIQKRDMSHDTTEQANDSGVSIGRERNLSEIWQDDEVSLRSSVGSETIANPIDITPSSERKRSSKTNDMKPFILSESNSSPSSHNNYDHEVEGREYFQSKWKLVETLLDVLGIMDGASSFSSETIMDRLKLGMKVGLVLGLNAVSQMNESIGQFIASDNDRSSTSMYPKGGISNKVRSPLTKAVDSVGWIVVRLLLNIYLQGATVDNEIVETSPYIQALMKLTSILNSLKDKNKAYFGLEVCNVVCRILQALYSTTSQKPGSVWCIEGYRAIFTLLPSQRSTIIQYITLSAESGNAASNDLLAILTKNNDQKKMFGVRSSQSSSANIDTSSPQQLISQVKSIISETSSCSCADVIIDIIKLSLAIPIDESTPLSWSQWMQYTAPILEDAQKIEDDFYISKTTEQGMHKGSHEGQSTIMIMRNEMQNIRDRISSIIEDVMNKVIIFEHKRFKDWNRSDDSFRKRCLTNWNHLLADIANERGPWGAGVEIDHDKNYWILDNHEDNYRLYSIMIKNPYGSRHAGSSYLAQHSFASTRDLMAMDNIARQQSNRIRSISMSTEDNMSVSSSRRSPITSPRSNKLLDDGNSYLPIDTSISSSQSDILAMDDTSSIASHHIKKKTETKFDLWRDLMKYQRRASDLNNQSMMDTLDGDEDLDNAEKSSDTYDEDSLDDIQDSNITSSAPEPSPSTSSSPREKLLFRERCEIITPSTNSSSCRSSGYFEITKSKLSFIRDQVDGVMPVSQSSKGSSKIVIPASPSFHNHSSSSVLSASQLQTSISNESQWAYNSHPSAQWSTSDIYNISQRYYQLRFVAVEVFFASRTCIFINFHEKGKAFKFQRLLRLRVRPPLLGPLVAIKPMRVFSHATLTSVNGVMQSITQAWVNHDITNFEYLMRLNQYAGRTHHDLGQYPVFPWILADYTSEELDLLNPASYRDLHYPIGAQNHQQRELVMMKYNELNNAFDGHRGGVSIEQGAMPPFHFGTHYSVAGFILWYLIRCEPFTSLHIQLQDGKFDKPDRLFESIENTYRSCVSNPSDVKELIPEMFYLPECLLNENKIDFGVTQTGRRIDDVILPPWAKNAYDFIRIHREALESDYVSKNLHHWIDLIFGYKQRPPYLGGSPSAADACNCFYHLTYSEAVDLDKLRRQDKHLYDQFICQISEFGCTPAQLFKKPHPERAKFSQLDVVWPIASILPGVHTITNEAEIPRKPKRIVSYSLPHRISQNPIIFISELMDADRGLLTFDTNRIMAHHSWQALQPSAVPPFKLKIDTTATEMSKGSTGQSMLSSMISSYNNASNHRERRIGVPFAPPLGYYSALRKDAIDKLNESQKWKPMKINAYEKMERKEKESRQMTMSTDNISSSSAAAVASVTVQSNMSNLSSDLTSTPGRSQYPNPSKVASHLEKLKQESSSSSMLDENQSSVTSSSSSSSTSLRLRSLSDSSFSTQSATAGSKEHPQPQTKPRSSSIIESSLPMTNTIGHLQVSDDHVTSKLFILIPELKLFFSAGHWDNSLRVTSIDTGKLLQSVTLHSDVVTCLATASDFGTHYLVSGSRDCTLIVWMNITHIAASKDEMILSQPRVLYGHDDTVNTVAVSAQLNIVVSGSNDGTVIIHSLRDCTYIRSILVRSSCIPSSISSSSATNAGDNQQHIEFQHHENQQDDHPIIDENLNLNSSSTTNRSPITKVAISKERYIIMYSATDSKLHTYSINGALLASKKIHERIHALILSEDGHVLLTGGDNCLVVLRWIHNLELANNGPRKGLEAIFNGAEEDGSQAFASPIRSLYLTKLERHLMVGLESGELKVLAMDGQYIRQRLQRKLIEIGIL